MFCEVGIDWSATGAMLSGIGTMLAGSAALYALLFAYPDWKKRELYKARSADARDIMSAFYEGRQVLDNIRAPGISPAEISKAEQYLAGTSGFENADEGRKQRLTQMAVTLLRIDEFEEFWQGLYRLLPVAKAVFSPDVEDALFQIIRTRQRVIASARAYQTAPGDLTPYEQAIWKNFGNPDPIDAERKLSEQKLDGTLSQCLRGSE